MAKAISSNFIVLDCAVLVDVIEHRKSVPTVFGTL